MCCKQIILSFTVPALAVSLYTLIRALGRRCQGRSMLRGEILGFSRLQAAQPITFYDLNRLDEKETIWIPFEGKYSGH
jgi:hypothetical protein